MLQNPLKDFSVKPVFGGGGGGGGGGNEYWGFCEKSCFLISKDFCGQTLYVFIIICPEVMGVLIFICFVQSDRI